MNKHFKLALGAAILFGSHATSAKHVTLKDAKIVAGNFISTKSEFKVSDLRLLSAQNLSDLNNPHFYIFSINDENGFVIVSADDVAQPILAYSLNSPFMDAGNKSPEVSYWLREYQREIDYMLDNDIAPTEEREAEWIALLNGFNIMQKPTATSVEPFLETTWNQSPYYNKLSPGSGNSKTPIGCVATAMAQIMKYWNYPDIGVGQYSYNGGSYGTLSADFTSEEYQWGLMPSSLTANSHPQAIDAVALLNYHCAVSVRMNFAPGGSGSFVVQAPGANYPSALKAFRNYFKYSSVEGKIRDNYLGDWVDLLKDDIANGYPILYAGHGSAGGHAFIFDGYDENDYFHVDWGWNGMSNGYFTVSNLAPGSLGIGGGGGGFNYGQEAIFNIVPDGQSHEISLALGDNLVLSDNEIYHKDSFSVTANAANLKSLHYFGIINATVYNADDSTVAANINRFGNQVIEAGDDSTYVFSTTSNGLNSLTPGDYFIRITHRGGASRVFEPLDDINFTNYIPLKVLERDDEPVDSSNSVVNISLSSQLNLHPNPAKDVVSIIHSENLKIVDISMIDLNGRVISGQILKQINDNEYLLNVSGLANGIYVLKVQTEKGIGLKKLVIQQ